MTIDRMKEALEPVKLYDTDAPGLSAELRTYAAELDRIDTMHERLLREMFLSTAQSEGLGEYELIFGPERISESLSERREKLMMRLTLGGGDFTVSGVSQALDSFGLDYIISEFPSLNRLNIIAQADYSKPEQNYIKREVGKIIPSHIAYQLVFNTLKWSQLDARDKTFAQLDGDNLTWKQIDEIE